jgi:hypothetical protein
MIIGLSIIIYQLIMVSSVKEAAPADNVQVLGVSTDNTPPLIFREEDVLLDRPAILGNMQKISHIDSQKCYEMDYAAASNKVGNYVQKTNNYMHGYPDSCSGTRQELITAFYQM